MGSLFYFKYYYYSYFCEGVCLNLLLHGTLHLLKITTVHRCWIMIHMMFKLIDFIKKWGYFVIEYIICMTIIKIKINKNNCLLNSLIKTNIHIPDVILAQWYFVLTWCVICSFVYFPKHEVKVEEDDRNWTCLEMRSRVWDEVISGSCREISVLLPVQFITQTYPH